MPLSSPAIDASLSETDFAALVEAILVDPARQDLLIDLLREDHDVYAQRSTAAVVRMRGWVLLALGRAGVTDDTLVFVLEELDTSLDPYLVAAAARALRSYARPSPELTPMVAQAIENLVGRDAPVSLDRYGEYVAGDEGTTPILELLDTVHWLGPAAREALPALEALRRQRDLLSRKSLARINRVITVLRKARTAPPLDCCAIPGGLRALMSSLREQPGTRDVRDTIFEDHLGTRLSYERLFTGHVSIVVFFYTRCDNPLKCSLTVTKLAELQRLLDARGLHGVIHTAAITYDPAFDLPGRLHEYGTRRGVRFDDTNRMLRTPDGPSALQRHFRLGVNFVRSIVNRHRVEAYVLDRDGRVAIAFSRMRWHPDDLVERAAAVAAATPRQPEVNAARIVATPALGSLATIAWMLVPKCPMCWSAYLSAAGIAGLDVMPYLPWLHPVFLAIMSASVVSTWTRARISGRLEGAMLATLGLVLVVLTLNGAADLAGWGAALLVAGSVTSYEALRRSTDLRMTGHALRSIARVSS